MTYTEITSLLGDESESLLTHVCQHIPKETIHQPDLHHVWTIFQHSDRSPEVVANLQRLYSHGRLANTGYLSILPVDQGIEHSAAYSFAKNPLYFDPENIVRLAIEGGTNGVVSTVGALGLIAKKYASQIPLIVKVNHNELLTYPTKHDQILFSSAEQAAHLGAVGIGATIYFGSPESNRQIVEIAQVFALAHELGLFTILWCYPRNKDFNLGTKDYQTAADITSQANHLGVTIGADIIKQKLPAPLFGFQDLRFGKLFPQLYESLTTTHPIDLVRLQVAHCYMGKIGLINSGGGSQGDKDLAAAVRTAVINKRGGGQGLIMGRKVFNRPFDEGVALLHAVQDVFLDEQITIA